MPAPYQLFPELAPDDFEALKRDIAERGVMVPVEYDEDGNVLDGHHRLRAYEELGREGIALPPPPSIVREGMTEREKREHVRRLNILRRHLTQEQKRELIREQVRETPERSNRQIAGALGVSDKTVGSVRSELESGAEIPHLDRVEGPDGKSYPRHQPVRQEPEPSPDLFDDYIPEPDYGYDEPIADSDGVEHVTYPMAVPDPEPEPEPIDIGALADDLDDDGAVARARLLAQYSAGIAAASKLAFLDPTAVVGALSRERQLIHGEHAGRLRAWLDRIDAEMQGAASRPLKVVGGTLG